MSKEAGKYVRCAFELGIESGALRRDIAQVFDAVPLRWAAVADLRPYLASLHLGGVNRIRHHLICAGVQNCQDVSVGKDLIRRDTPCYSASLLAKKPDSKGAVHSTAARVRGNGPPARPRPGRSYWTSHRRPIGLALDPLTTLTLGWARMRRSFAHRSQTKMRLTSTIDRQNSCRQSCRNIDGGERRHDRDRMGTKDLSGRENCDRRGRPRGRGRPGRRRAAKNFAFAERLAITYDPGLGKPGHRILSKRCPAFSRAALCLRDGVENPRLVIWNVRVRYPQQHEFSRDDAFCRQVSPTRDPRCQTSIP